MSKVGRNDPCGCGSGQKYKKCCENKVANKQIGGGGSLGNYFPPNFVDNPYSLGEVKRIPNYEDYSGVPVNNITYSKFEKILGDEKVGGALGLNDIELRYFQQKMAYMLPSRKREFVPKFLDSNQFSSLVSDMNTIRFANSIYWNEIDQYVHLYKVGTFNFISDRLCRLIEYFDDVVTSSGIARQVVETITNAIANQWVITTAFNNLNSHIERNENFYTVAWKELEAFAMSLSFCSKKSYNQFIKGTKRIKGFTLDKDYKVSPYEPTSYQQLSICKYVAANIVECDITFDKDIIAATDNLDKYYKILCKFVHPTPHILKESYDLLGVDWESIEIGLKEIILKCLYEALIIYSSLIENEIYYSCNFLNHNIIRLLARPGDLKGQVNIDKTFIDGVVNKFKDLVVETTKEKITVVKKTNPH